eukprot:gene4182-104_t
MFAGPYKERAPPSRLVQAMDAEVRPDNPYSRLMALKSMGVVVDYERIRNHAVAIVGVGGVGSVVAEMLTRCGVGALVLFDYDKVELANMNRMFFRPDQQGLSKVEAASATLRTINPDVRFETHDYNIITPENFAHMKGRLASAGDGGRSVDLVLCCVDNFEARVAVSQMCMELDLRWFESGVSEDALSGHVQFMVPGISPCYECCPPLVLASAAAPVKRKEACAASLPTTMSVIAGFMVQNTLKLLLEFGQVSPYIAWDSLVDHFPVIQASSPPWSAHSCNWPVTTAKAGQAMPRQEAAPAARPPLVHENTWDIGVEDSSGDAEAEGPAPDVPPEDIAPVISADGSVDLKTLAQQLSELSSN